MPGAWTLLPGAEADGLAQLAGVVVVSALGGGMNSIAGGGTLLTFPALVGLGVPPLVANATSTVALWPGALGSMWGYRAELAGARGWALRFAVPSVVGGLLGAVLLLATGEDRFQALAPWLVLGATVLFAAQGSVLEAARRRRTRREGGAGHRGAGSTPAGEVGTAEALDRPPPPRLLWAQLAVSVYGGYFGAGVGILMLAMLGMMGMRHIHRMNGLKNWGGLCMNLVAAAAFATQGVVDWPVAAGMAVGATLGGYAGSRLAQKVPQVLVRRAITLIGFASGVWLL